jgi:hypothetical protein
LLNWALAAGELLPQEEIPEYFVEGEHYTREWDDDGRRKVAHAAGAKEDALLFGGKRNRG